MTAPQVQVNSLIAADASGNPTMTSREIAELTGKEHKNVLADIRKMLAELGYGPAEFSADLPDAYGRPQAGFALPKRESLLLVSGYSLSLRAKIIDRWEDLERQVRQPVDLMKALDDPAFLRQALAHKNEEVVNLRAINTELAPKALALDLISASSGSVTITQASKILGKKRADLTGWMHANGWVYRQNGSWVAYKPQIDNGRLEYKEANYTDQSTGMACRKSYCHITQKGLTKLAMVFGVALGKAA